MKIPYGYTQDDHGTIAVHQVHAAVVNLIYDLYLQGKRPFANHTKSPRQAQGIPSPSGKPVWGRAAIDDILSKSKYVPLIVSEEKFYAAQFEKDRRSNTNDYKTRKAARYSSQNVLSGLLVCENCGRNFRRVTRPAGEVVWRCADKVENGKRASCTNDVTISEEDIKALICEQLGLADFDEDAVWEAVELVEIGADGVDVQMKALQTFGMVM
jgi:hypothetical protein